ncbi:uncharacterized protein LOC134237945 [Saccostrea cucullata]|uniref:uncharacterized protein LOC134237945 n=1 Tax=Saccostrea cuccullata TaxID=36930 RepID=UPI002ED52D79
MARKQIVFHLLVSLWNFVSIQGSHVMSEIHYVKTYYTYSCALVQRLDTNVPADGPLLITKDVHMRLVHGSQTAQDVSQVIVMENSLIDATALEDLLEMTEYADILDNLFKLKHNHHVLTNPSHSVDPGPHPVVWSNYRDWNLAETVWTAKYATIGGYLVMENREQIISETHYLVGTTKTLQYVFRWDFVTPYHCLENMTITDDCRDPLVAPDLTESPTISISWEGWYDDLSGMKEYQYEIQTLSSRNDILQEDGFPVNNGTGIIYLNESLKTLRLPGSAGLFSIHLTAHDNAGNYKTARRFVLYDSDSRVSYNPLYVTRVQSASKNTNYTWVVDDTKIVNVQWTKRFRNILHDHNKWLNEISPSYGITKGYDDYSGPRSVNKVNNVYGCVGFKTEYSVFDGESLKDSRPLASVNNISTESDLITMNWSDGDKAVIIVVAVDIFNKTLNDTVTVYRDASPPVIENLWLTRGDMLNVSVHSLEDFRNMTIEWLAYDYHSGIDSIYWRLYDNFTGEIILHGHEEMFAQGSSQDLAECIQKYGNYSRGPKCYQTNYWGAYHQHFQVKPDVKKNGGLIPGKEIAAHDSDYFIEINATNKALLSTILTKKITIDVSPPQTGTVQDGIRGTNEVDFQQSKTLNAHWDGFFDKESGVMFYMYGFDKKPIPANAFQLDSSNLLLKETYATYATHTVSTEGTYYICVVAYNRALEPSKPVCSDGVTVTTAVPSVSEVDITNAYVREGLVTDIRKTTYWIVNKNRQRRLVANPTEDCLRKAVPLSDVDIFPVEKFKNGSYVKVNGSVICTNTSTAPGITNPVLSKSAHIILSWYANETSIHDYEVGLSTVAGSTAPDLLPFRSTQQHRRIHLMHTDIPEREPFYLIIKTISRSNVEGIQSIGPCSVDITPPVFFPPIKVNYHNGHLIAVWNSSSFTDAEDPFPLSVQCAVGHIPRGTQIQNYSPLQAGDGCILTEPPTCTAIPINDTEWKLHGNHTYYVTIKAENIAGLSSFGVSEPYIHNVQLPSTGIVMDILNNTENPFIETQDADYTSSENTLSARWTGFSHAYLDVTYKFQVGTSTGAADVVPQKYVGKNNSHTEQGLSLEFFKTYYITITAVTSAGSVEVTSDGITVVQENATLSGISVFDGEPCNMSEQNTSQSILHHDWDISVNCTNDTDFQSSTDTLNAYWTISKETLFFVPDTYYSIERKSAYSDDWSIFQDFTYNHGHMEAHVTGLSLEPGKMYRFVLKLCAGKICYLPTHSNGVVILASPPEPGDISFVHENSSLTEELKVTMDMFRDPDIEILTEKYSVIKRYEWAITDQSDTGRLHTIWQELTEFEVIPGKYKIKFTIKLSGKLDFSKCRRLTVRGYNKAGLSSTISGDIKDCSNPLLITPKVVIDAVGTQDPSKDGYGEPIYMERNASWPYPDMDYTPNKNYISAVWPSLRYIAYTVAVIKAWNINMTTMYKPSTTLALADPCSHPDSIRCADTDREFINIKFREGELENGQRYIVCIHTEHTEIHEGQSSRVLPEINACSDGVVVDLTPPSKGSVWIGKRGQQYQISTTDMYVTWDSFKDVEEIQTISHSSGVQNYQLGIGTFIGGNDIVAFTDVGVSNHKALHGLSLQSGHKYYATIKATDFVNRTTTQTSSPIIVDTSPPSKSDNPITLTGRHITSVSEIEACWKNIFSDPESGIDFYMWSVGSEPGYSDIMDYTREDTECGANDKNYRLDIKEGHAYYINVKAFNKARLVTSATSWAYTVDFSPPSEGYVLELSPSGNSKLDIDYQTDINKLMIFWEGFYDPHSSIKEFFVTVGTCRRCDDVIRRQSVGLVKEMTVDYVHFGSGLTYYTSVTACNTAEFCTTAYSDGVIMDNSPPNVGVVTDGTSSNDKEHQSIRNWIGATWHGFTDPQSGISHYVWWVGTTPGGNDILPAKEVYLVEEATAYNFSQEIPLSKRIYVTVRAYNKAGLFVDGISNGFLVDETPPVISNGPKLTNGSALVENTQIYRSLVKIEWTVADPESHIERQYLSLRAHIGGDFNLSSTKVNGIARDFILNGLKLHDGVTYFITLISCNEAHLCSSSTSPGIQMDSTPPSEGTFAIQTDHAVDVELSRHVSGFMTWSECEVNLAWLGFSDAHSDISHYFVNVGSTYMGDDLNAVPGVPLRVNHSTTGADKYDEGRVQAYRISTQNLSAYDKLYICLWAVNKVGLSSPIIHSKFKKLPGGVLSLVRRCEAEECGGQCLCSPQDEVCHHNESLCNDVTIGNTNNLIHVSDLTFGKSDLNFTPSNNVLQGRWTIVDGQGSQPFIYQWSVGITNHEVPFGVLDPQNDIVWNDAGQNKFITYITTSGQSLIESVSYSVFVRAWYNKTTYAVFKSKGVTVQSAELVVFNISQGRITEKMIESTIEDDDFVKSGTALLLNWTDKFADNQDSIRSYQVYISTTPGGHAVWETEDLPNTETTYMISGLSLPSGIQYFTNVIVYGFSGVHHTESSDGFIIDDDKPGSGVVWDGIGLYDLEYQNSSTSIHASWQGFLDTVSGIRNYFWCVGNTTTVSPIHSNTECNIWVWENVGNETSISKILSEELANGKIYYSKVYAVDNVGYKSDIAVSDGVTIDTTPPEPEYLYHIDKNLLLNPSFEISKKSLAFENIHDQNICTLGDDFVPDYWNLTHGSCATVVSSLKIFARDGKSFLFVRGSVKQVIYGLTIGEIYRVIFYTSHFPTQVETLANKEVFLNIGKKKQVFLLYSKVSRHDEQEVSATREIVSWQKHSFYFTAENENTDLEIGSTDIKTGLLIDNVTLQSVNRILKNSNDSHVSAHIVYTHQWGSIHGAWSFFEDVSPIVEYQWAIGYTEGGTEIQGFTSVGLNNFGINTNVTLVHNSYIHVTVVATNAVGLSGLVSTPVYIDLTPPVFYNVYDGRLWYDDEDTWKDNKVIVNFARNDEESGIHFCEWAIGYHPYGTDLQTFEKLPYRETFMVKDFNYSVLENRTIFSTIRCHNRAGLSASKSSDGVKISD